MRIEVSISPYSFKKEAVAVGRIMEGGFVQDRELWTVLNDSRLTVERRYQGPYQKASSVHHYAIEVPDGYPLAIAKKSLTGQVTTEREREFEILYHPGREAQHGAN